MHFFSLQLVNAKSYSSGGNIATLIPFTAIGERNHSIISASFTAMTAELIEVIQCLENDHPEAELIITGDLNCPNITYSPCESNFLVPQYEQTRQADLRLIQFLDSSGYKQLIEDKNNFGNTLDVFFTKKPGNFAVRQLDDDEKIEPKNPTHDAIAIELFPHEPEIMSMDVKNTFKSIKWRQVSNEVKETTWETIYDELDPNASTPDKVQKYNRDFIIKTKGIIEKCTKKHYGKRKKSNRGEVS